MSEQHSEIKLSDYQKTGYQVESIDLKFELFEDKSIVTNSMRVIREEEKNMFLHGQELKLVSLKVNNSDFEYKEIDGGIELSNLPREFSLEIITEIHPESNTSCEGLYQSSGIFCTQCEAQGFRKITYYFDRPDMMSSFSTRIEADKKKYPMLLSNGNKVDSGELEQGRHWVLWEDPFKKPAYLFALVAGDLALVKDTFKTMSGRDVSLEIYVDHGNEDRCDHAMTSLKKSMKWDEETFGLEYDLDIYMIVAVDSFNMGAMENKGLNIFNTVYVLAKEETAVDEEYLGIESVIGHEYFHNWTGNRVTCRDWFQLTLKEGLTVFRDQEFSADMFDPTVQRIMDVSRLKEGQYPEDSGAMAHPIKPKSYIEINNFYTATIYEKGAEVIRMIHTLIGANNFKKGMTKYFELFDGQAVRTEDFVHAMELVSDKDLTQFKRWYDFAGTPIVHIESYWNDGEFEVSLTQEIPETGNDGLELEPLHIPFVYAINGKRSIIELTDWNTKFTLKTDEHTVCEWNLDFSAPVHIKDQLGTRNLQSIVSKGSNAFSRWEAFQALVSKSVQGEYNISELCETLGEALNSSLPEAIKAKLLTLPSEVELNAHLSELAPGRVQKWIEEFKTNLASKFPILLKKLYENADEQGFSLEASSIGKRMLRGKCLSYLAYNSEDQALVYKHFTESRSMNDQYRSLCAMVHAGHPQSDEALSKFYEQWKSDKLVINKWLTLQALRKGEGVLKRIEALTEDPIFDWAEPNKVRSLFTVFAMRNLSEFHGESGEGYRLVTKVIKKLDASNPQIGARLAKSFRDAAKLNAEQRVKLIEILEGISGSLSSPDCSEVIGKTLGALR